MSEEQDEASKTEEPSAKRLREAREKGNVPVSREVNSWFMLLALALFFLVFLSFMAEQYTNAMTRFIEKPESFEINSRAIVKILFEIAEDYALILAAPLGLAILAALAGGLVQNGLIFSAANMEPKLEKISPIKGLKRLFSMRSLIEFAKSILKLILIVGVVSIVVIPDLDSFETMVSLSMVDFLALLHWEVVKIIGAVVALITLIAVIDLLYQRFDHTKKLRMTKQELKDEYKQTEGDPHIKGRLRQLRNEKARQRMMANVPDSAVVVTNPTHYAVALKYDQDSMAAPTLVAKGTDLVAKRIRDLAMENEIPIVENPPLARALHAGVELDQEVPQEHYQTVAEIIGYVMRLKQGIRPDSLPHKRAEVRDWSFGEAEKKKSRWGFGDGA